MGRLAGELCDGLRLHPIATFRFATEKVLPAVAAGAAQAGRSAQEIDMIGAPFLAIAPNAEGVAAAKQALKQHIAFYASTRTYHTVLRFHGWEDIGLQLHQLVREGKWQELPKLITDEMLSEWAVIATYDRLASEVRARCTGIFSTVLLDLPGTLARDEDRVRSIVQSLHQP